MLESLKNKRIMVVVAHPDDEVLGLGATINLLSRSYNCIIRAIILGEGITSRSDQRNVEEWEKPLAIHKQNILAAQKTVGYESVGIYDFPDNRFDSVDLLNIIKVIEKEKLQFSPDIIFTHHGGDLNIDHQRTFESVITACRPLTEEKVKTIITFETFSGTEWQASSDPRQFIPNMFVSVSKENMTAKINAMEKYEFEKRPFPHPRSPKAMEIVAQRWGIAVGTEYAEAFIIIRSIN
jgi:LmbE family N-acetylglucosaminyl deacetylase